MFGNILIIKDGINMLVQSRIVETGVGHVDDPQIKNVSHIDMYNIYHSYKGPKSSFWKRHDKQTEILKLKQKKTWSLDYIGIMNNDTSFHN